jgi:hypothetical protein
MFLLQVFDRLKRHGRLLEPEVKQVMRQSRYLLLSIVLVGLAIAPSVASGIIPYFVVLQEGADLLTFSNRLEKMGAKIRLQMPPNVLTFEADSSLNINDAGPVARMYKSMVPLSDMSGYGALAEAAAVQWNRDMMARASKQGFRTASAMRSLAAQSSLPSPLNLTLTLDASRVHAVWSGAAGAGSYLVQISKSSTFADKVETVVLKAEADLPRLETNGSEPMYARIWFCIYGDTLTLRPRHSIIRRSRKCNLFIPISIH